MMKQISFKRKSPKMPSFVEWCVRTSESVDAVCDDISSLAVEAFDCDSHQQYTRTSPSEETWKTGNHAGAQIDSDYIEIDTSGFYSIVCDQNPKDFAKSKAHSRNVRRHKELERQVKDQRNRIQSLLQSHDEMKAKLAKQKKDEKIEDQNSSHEVGRVFFSLVDVRSAHVDYTHICADPAACAAISSVLTPADLVREVVAVRVSQTFHCNLKLTQKEIRTKGSVQRSQYEKWFSELPLLSEDSLRAHRAWFEESAVKFSEEQLSYLEIKAVKSGPSGAAKATLTAVKLATFAMDLSLCPDWTSVLAATAKMFIYTATPTMMEYIMKFAGQDLTQYFSTFAEKSTVQSDSTIEDQNMFDDLRQTVRSCIAIEEKISEIPLANFIDQVICMLVFFNQDDESTTDKSEVVPSSRLWKDLVFRATKIHRTDSLAMVGRVATVIDLALMISETLWSGKSYLLLVNPLNISLRLAKMEGLYVMYKSGNLEHMTFDGKPITPRDYEEEVLALSHDIETIVEKRMVKPAAMRAYTAYLAKAIQMKSHIETLRRVRGLKVQPTFFGLCSAPGVGKTGLAQDIRAAVEVALDIVIAPEHEYGGSTDYNGWQTGFTSATKFLNVAEVGNQIEDGKSANIFFDAARQCDNKYSEIPQADADMKGMCFNHLHGAVFASNQMDFGMYEQVSCVGAHSRRFRFYEVTTLPQYGKNPLGDVYYVPDTDKIPYRMTSLGAVPEQDIYEFQQYIFLEREVEGDTSGKAREHSIKKIGPKMTHSQWMTAIVAHIRNTNAESLAYNNMLILKRSIPRCAMCACMENWCTCTKFVPRNIDLAREREMQLKERSWCDYIPTSEQVIYKAGRFKDAVSQCVSEYSFGSNKSMAKLIDTDLSRFAENTIKDENWSDYGLLGETIEQASGYLLCLNIPLSLSVSYWMHKIVGSFLKVSLSYVFNIKTSFCCACLFWMFPPVALAVFCVMYFISCSVATASEFIARRTVAQKVVRGEKVKYWDSPLLLAVGALAAMGSIYAVYQYSKPRKEEDTDELTIVDNGGMHLVTSQDVYDRLHNAEKWEQRVVYDVPAPHEAFTATTDQVHNILTKNTVLIETPLCKIRGTMISGNYCVAPVHKDEIVENQCVKLHRKGCQGAVLVHVLKIGRLKTNVESDLCVIVFNQSLLVRDISAYFDHSFSHTSDTDSLGPCILFTDTPQITSPRIQEVSTTNRKFIGISAPVQSPTKLGDCGLPLIRTAAPRCVVGMHVAIRGTAHSHCAIVSKKMIDAVLSELITDQSSIVAIRHSNVLFDNSVETMKPLEHNEPSERVATRFLRSKEDFAVPFSVVPLGHSHARIQKKSTVEVSLLSQHLDAAGITRMHGAPSLNANRAASAFTQLTSRNARPRGPALQRALIRKMTSRMVEQFKKFHVDIRALSMEEVMQGVYGNDYAKSMNLTTACGGGYPGKKRSRVDMFFNPDEDEMFDLDQYIDDDDSDSEFEVDVVMVSEDDAQTIDTNQAVVGTHERVARANRILKREMAHIKNELRKHKSCNAINTCCLKDEPILLTKIALMKFWGRIITDVPMAFHCFDTMIYGMILSYFRTFALVSGCWEGISPYSEDWHEIMAYISEFPYVLDMDTKKMDQSMNFQDLNSVFELFASITDEISDDKDLVFLMRARGLDMSTPIIDMFGEWVGVYMNTSGNKLTITINGIAGVGLRVMEAYVAYKMFVEYPRSAMETIVEALDYLTDAEVDAYLEDFDENVRYGAVGDDAVLSTKLVDFDLSFIADYFECKGVTITGASKGAERSVGMHISDLKMCKRGVRWMPEAERIVGPLDESSIFRALHCYVPSHVSRDVIEVDCVDKAMEELTLHGKDVFEDRVSKLRTAVLSANRMGLHYHAFSKTYEDRVQIFLDRYPTSHRNRTPFDPFLEDQNGLINQLEARVIRYVPRLHFRSHYLGSEMLEHCRLVDVHGLDPAPALNFWISNQNTENTAAEQQQNIKFFLQDSLTQRTEPPHSNAPASRTIRTYDSSIDMLERPVKLHTFAWNYGSDMLQEFNPWVEMFDSRVIQQRTQHYRHFRANLRLTFTIKSNPFHYGRCWAVYNMLARSDDFTQLEKLVKEDYIEASQRPLVNIDSRGAQGGELLLPFVHPRDFVDLTSNELEGLGNISLFSISKLQSANAATGSAVITVYGKFEDVELYTPTSLALGEIQDQNRIEDQNEMEIVDVPTTGQDLTLAQESPDVSVDPGITWDSAAETSFASIGGKKTWIGQYSWNVTHSTDHHIVSLRCSPFHGMIKGTGISAEYHLTPSAYIGVPFEIWRGTCEYIFEVDCSTMHRGALRVVYDPVYGVRTDEYNLNYSSIFDIGSNNVHVAKIGWGQNTTFLPTITGMSELVNASSTPYSTVVPYGNGVLSLYVQTPLLSPTPLNGLSVVVNVYSRMLPDYEVALLREPLVGMKLMDKPIPPQVLVQPLPNTTNSNPQSVSAASTPIRPLNSSLATSRTLYLCELPAMAFVTNQKVSTYITSYLDNSIEAELADVDMNDGKTPAILVRVDPFDYTSQVSFGVRDFVQGPTEFYSESYGSKGAIIKRVTALSGGITNTDFTDLNFDFTGDTYEPGDDKPNGTFFISNDDGEQFKLGVVRLDVPAFKSVDYRVTPTAAIRDINNLIKWYQPSDTEFLSPLPAAATYSGPLRGKIVLPPTEQDIIARLPLMYRATGNGVLWFDGLKDRVHLKDSGAVARHTGIHYTPQGSFDLTVGATFTPLSAKLTILDPAQVRVLIKDQNFIQDQNDVGPSMEMYGPQLIKGVEHDFLQDVVTDIRQPMSINHSYRCIVCSPPGIDTSIGYFPITIPHFPTKHDVPTLGAGQFLARDDRFTHYIEYYMRMFACVRGSTVVEILDTSHFYPRDIVWAQINRTRGILPNPWPAPIAVARALPTSPANSQWMNMSLHGRGEFKLPWYNKERFGYARSEDPDLQSPYHYRLTLGAAKGASLNVNYKIGTDFSLSHFISTPVLKA